jgi:predicted helicase
LMGVSRPQREVVARRSYADLWGLRQAKYEYLASNDLTTTGWQRLQPMPPYYFLAPQDNRLSSEFDTAWSISDVLPLTFSGIKTHRDQFAVAFQQDTLGQRIEALRDTSLSDDALRDRFGLRDTGTWQLARAREAIRSDDVAESALVRCLYRPFDVRWLWYHDAIVGRARREGMLHLLRDNVAMVVGRAGHVVESARWNLLYVTNRVVDTNIYRRGGGMVFPLYVYTENKKVEPVKRGGSAITLALFESQAGYGTRRPNLSPEFVTTVANKLVLDFTPDGKGDLENTFGPEDIFNYMYAIFHSPTYRERYAEFLKIDFPRLPLTSDLGLFRVLAEKGEELVALHLMESPALDHTITRFPIRGSNEVEKVRYAEDGRVYINKTQYFEGVEPEVWEFHIGGYQVLHKWLKDRKGRTLSYDDVTHYGKIVVALKETMRLMEEIDEAIPSWPIE